MAITHTLAMLGLALVTGQEEVNSSLDEQTKRFLAEAPPKWKLWHDFFLPMQLSVAIRTIGNADAEEIAHETHKILRSRSGEFGLFLWDRVNDGKTRAFCWAFGTTYSFVLQKTESGADWLVKDCDLTNKTREKDLYWKGIRDMGGSTTGATGLKGLGLNDWKIGVDCRIDKAESLPGNAIRFHFSKNSKRNSGARFYPESGWFTVLPDDYWLLSEYEVELVYDYGPRATVHTTLEYGKRKQGFPILTRSVIHTVSLKEKVDQQEIQEYHLEDRDIAPEEVSLSAFGLPEPMGSMIRQKSYRHYWFFGAGLACLVVLLWFFKRKSAAPSANA